MGSRPSRSRGVARPVDVRLQRTDVLHGGSPSPPRRTDGDDGRALSCPSRSTATAKSGRLPGSPGAVNVGDSGERWASPRGCRTTTSRREPIPAVPGSRNGMSLHGCRWPDQDSVSGCDWPLFPSIACRRPSPDASGRVSCKSVVLDDTLDVSTCPTNSASPDQSHDRRGFPMRPARPTTSESTSSCAASPG
jgi:hypothetical protein